MNILVLACAAAKNMTAQPLLHPTNGNIAEIVARPRLRGPNAYQPDSNVGQGYPGTWRDYIVQGNTQVQLPGHLLPAAQLYTNPKYMELQAYCGVACFYIFSAGWGIVRSDYGLPKYDITFSPAAGGTSLYKKRNYPTPHYNDCNHLITLPLTPTDHIYFLGGKSYWDPFANLTNGTLAQRFIIYPQPEALPAGINLQLCAGLNNMNWYYQCATNIMTQGHADHLVFP